MLPNTYFAILLFPKLPICPDPTNLRHIVFKVQPSSHQQHELYLVMLNKTSLFSVTNTIKKHKNVNTQSLLSNLAFFKMLQCMFFIEATTGNILTIQAGLQTKCITNVTICIIQCTN